MGREFLLLGLLGFGLPLSAGQIFGTLTESGKALPKGIEVLVDCSGEQAKGATDEFGAFRVNVQKAGKCTLTLSYKGQKPSATVASLAEPSSADFEVQAQEGKYKLVRR